METCVLGVTSETSLKALFPPWSDWSLEQTVDRVSASKSAEDSDAAGVERSSEPEETDGAATGADSSLYDAEYEELARSGWLNSPQPVLEAMGASAGLGGKAESSRASLDRRGLKATLMRPKTFFCFGTGSPVSLLVIKEATNQGLNSPEAAAAFWLAAFGRNAFRNLLVFFDVFAAGAWADVGCSAVFVLATARSFKLRRKFMIRG